jgi:hypothetical protein
MTEAAAVTAQVFEQDVKATRLAAAAGGHEWLAGSRVYRRWVGGSVSRVHQAGARPASSRLDTSLPGRDRQMAFPREIHDKGDDSYDRDRDRDRDQPPRHARIYRSPCIHVYCR